MKTKENVTRRRCASTTHKIRFDFWRNDKISYRRWASLLAMKSPVAFLLACMLLANAEQPFEADFSPITDAGNYSTFLESVIKTGTDEVISASSPSVTIFGPSDDAFIAISDQIASITDQELVDILLGHVVINSSITADVLAKEGCIVATTAQGQNISIYRDPLTGEIDVDGVQVVESISGDFGIFHGLQSVLLPGAIDFLDCPAIPDFSPIVEDGKYGAVLNAMIETNKDFLVAVNMPVSKSCMSISTQVSYAVYSFFW